MAVKCGARSLVHKVPFTLEEQVETTKTDETRILFAKNHKPVTQQAVVYFCSNSMNQS